jgi:hypothetical protein
VQFESNLLTNHWTESKPDSTKGKTVNPLCDTLKTLRLSDKFGHKITLQAAAALQAMIYTFKYKPNSKYDFRGTNGLEYRAAKPNDDDFIDAISFIDDSIMTQSSLQVGNYQGFYFTQTYSPKLIHSLSDPNFSTVYVRSKQLSLVKTHGQYTFPSNQFFNLITHSDKNTLLKTISEIQRTSEEALVCEGEQSVPHLFEIGNTAVQIIPMQYLFTTNIFYLPQRLISLSDEKPLPQLLYSSYPHHITKNAAGNYFIDKFLEEKSFRLIATNATLILPIFPQQPFLSNDFLFADNELNFSITATLSLAENQELLAYTAQKKFDLIILDSRAAEVYNTEKPSNRQAFLEQVKKDLATSKRYKYCFRYKK